MHEPIKVLQAELKDDMNAIAEAFSVLHEITQQSLDDKSGIVASYYLHVIYGLIENMLVRIALLFENQIDDQSQWHSQLLQRMTLEISDIRPPVISKNTYAHLNELRRFRHLFRNAYLLRFDPVRLKLVLKDAEQVEKLFQNDIEKFQAFLDSLLES
jgi:hypothetical protein